MQREGREKPINEINPRTLSVSLREACFIANFHRVGWRTFCFMNTKQTSYSEKLRDPRWQKKRLCVMQRDGFACRDCGDEKSTLQVHHCHYEKGGPWATDERFLLTLCGDCHEERGEIEKHLKTFLGEILAGTPIGAFQAMIDLHGEMALMPWRQEALNTIRVFKNPRRNKDMNEWFTRMHQCEERSENK